MIRVLGAMSKACGWLAAVFFHAVGYGAMTGAVFICKALSTTFLAMDTMAFWAMAGTLCPDSSSYSIACPVPSPASLSVRLVIPEVS